MKIKRITVEKKKVEEQVNTVLKELLRAKHEVKSVQFLEHSDPELLVAFISYIAWE